LKANWTIWVAGTFIAPASSDLAETRRNVVVSRNPDFIAAGAEVAPDLPAALAALQQAGRGAAVLLNAGTDAAGLLGRVLPVGAAGKPAPPQMDLRTYGVGAQILRYLGVRRMKLLGNPRRMPSMTGYGLEVTGFVAAPHKPS